jgi:hypothetical protein
VHVVDAAPPDGRTPLEQAHLVLARLNSPPS